MNSSSWKKPIKIVNGKCQSWLWTTIKVKKMVFNQPIIWRFWSLRNQNKARRIVPICSKLKKKWKYEFSHQKWILMNESPNNNNFVTCRTAASKLTRGQKCFALIQILYFKSKRIQICYFDRHDYTEKKAQKKYYWKKNWWKI